MSWIYKAEKKFGKYAITNLMKYIMGLKIAGVVIGLFDGTFYYNWLAFDVQEILRGQVWRFFTFILSPDIQLGNQIVLEALFFFVMVYLYYFIGNAIERTWGTFRFNLYFFSGFFATGILSFLYAVISKDYRFIEFSFYPMHHLDYLFESMFLTFALMFPETSFLLYFIIPIKAKWLGYAGLAMSFFSAITSILDQNYVALILFIAAYGNFLFYYLMTSNSIKRARFFKQPAKKKKVRYRNTAFKTEEKVKKGSEARHKCFVCGRTEKDDENLVFRFCSKCEGNYEYCSDHLFTHEHISKH